MTDFLSVGEARVVFSSRRLWYTVALVSGMILSLVEYYNRPGWGSWGVRFIESYFALWAFRLFLLRGLVYGGVGPVGLCTIHNPAKESPSNDQTANSKSLRTFVMRFSEKKDILERLEERDAKYIGTVTI